MLLSLYHKHMFVSGIMPRRGEAFTVLAAYGEDRPKKRFRPAGAFPISGNLEGQAPARLTTEPLEEEPVEGANLIIA
jgi:hypothetical protein